MEGRKTPRRERERLQQRQEILDAALELFSEKGYHRVSMQEIAKKAEFAVGTLYKFFKNKEALYRALMLRLSEQFNALLTEALAGSENEVEKLRCFARAKTAHFRQHASQIRLYLSETKGSKAKAMAELDAEMRNRREKFMQTLSVVFEQGIAKGRFAPIAAPYHLAIAVESLTNGLLFLWLDDPQDSLYPEDPDIILDILFKGLIPTKK